MSKNPKVTIALAFVLTFLIGIGAGYMMRGQVQVAPAGQNMISSETGQRGWRSDDRDRLQRSERIERNERGERSERGDRPETRRQQNEGERARTMRDQDDVRGERGRQSNRDQVDSRREGRDYDRIRNRIKTELELSDAAAEELFEAFSQHRGRVKSEVAEKSRRIREHHDSLQAELHVRISEILTDEQLEIWNEKFAPRMDRQRFGRD